MGPQSPYWTRPETYRPERFDRRFRPENLAFWIPHFIRLGQIRQDLRVLDIGCGTGGFSLSLARQTGAKLVGFDISDKLLAYAKGKPDASLEKWEHGNAEELPFNKQSFDRVLMSFVIHQIEDRNRAFREVFRILRNNGILIVRTVTPEEVAKRIPFRFFPKVSEIESSRMPSIKDLTEMLSDAGFQRVESEVVLRNAHLKIDEIIESVESRSRPSFNANSDGELREGTAKMRKEWQATQGDWVDPRPVMFLIARK